MPQNYQYIPLSFITDFNEIKRQVINTVAITFLLNEKRRTTILNFYLENTQYGYTASALGEGTHRLLRITDINSGKVDWGNVPFCDCSEGEKYLLKKNDVLVARTGGTTGKSFLIENVPANAVFASYLIRLRTNQKCLPDFLNIYLNSYVFWSQISEMKSGSAQPNVNAEKLKTLVIPECSIDEQRKIISICRNENTGYYDSFAGRLKGKIEKIVAALDKNELISNELLQQQTYLQLLRQTILQEAVQGKLTQQNPADEPASELLKRIKAEKQKLIKEGKLKKEKELLPITDKEIRFELPEGWVWCRMSDVSYVGNGSTPDKSQFTTSSNDIPYLKVYNIVKQHVNFDYKPQYVKPDCHYGQLNRSVVYAGDVLMNIVGPPLGKVALVPNSLPECNINQAIVVIRPFHKALNKWIYWFLREQSAINSIVTKGTAGQDNISVTQSRNLLLPLPPLSEQFGIIEMIEKLTKHISQLEQQVTTSQTQARQLLQAVLAEAFVAKEKIYEMNEEMSLAAENNFNYEH